MRRIFGRKKKPAPEAPKVTLDDAISKSDGRIAALDEKIAKLNVELRGYSQQLKKARGGAQRSIKMKAVQALKRRKMYEKQREGMLATSFNMEQTNFAIQSVKDTQTTVEAMKTAAVTLREEQKKIDVDEIEDMQDDFEELLEVNDEVQELMGRSYGLTGDIDEADLEDELAGLEDEWAADDAYADGEADATPSYLLPEAGSGDVADPAAAAAGADEYGLPVAPAAAT